MDVSYLKCLFIYDGTYLRLKWILKLEVVKNEGNVTGFLTL